MRDLSLGALRRDHLFLITAMLGITLLAWVYTIHLASLMPGIDMETTEMAMPNMRSWQLTDVGFHFLMWIVMMVAMMTPTAAPMVLTFAYLVRRRNANQSPVTTSTLFMVAYLIIWVVFSLAATLLQWGLHSALLLPNHMTAVSPSLGGPLLILVGFYQFTPLKRACLVRCRTPLSFLLTEWRTGYGGSLIMGLRHGVFCTGCCWLLMLLLFVVGVMNLLWVALIAILVLVEKTIPTGQWLGRVTGLLTITWGIAILTVLT